jgi:hypothetical protein
MIQMNQFNLTNDIQQGLKMLMNYKNLNIDYICNNILSCHG